MNDMMQAAVDRQKQLEHYIAQRETEISEFKAELEKLGTLIGLAEELFLEQDTEPQQTVAPTPLHDAAPQSAHHPKPQNAAPRPAQPPQQKAAPQAQPAEQQPRAMPARPPRSA